jgi:DNA-binding response OmpR family regulator
MSDKKLKILVVDDDSDIRDTFRIVLESDGYDVFTARDGDEGLRKATEVRPDLVILDVMMRTTTEGFHVAYKLRQDKDLASVPILMLTGIQRELNMKFSPKEDGEYLPVDAFVEKPVDPEDLLARVKSLISKARKSE